MIRILIVDDQKLFQEAIRTVLECEKDFEVVGIADNGHIAIEQAEALQPDVVLMDMEMPELDGLSATQVICQRSSKIKVIVLSTHDSDEYVASSIRAGATGYLIKTIPSQELVKAIRFVRRGYARITPGLYAQILPTFKRVSTSLQAIELAEKISLKLGAHTLPTTGAIELSEKNNSLCVPAIPKKAPELLPSAPEVPPEKEMSWRQVVALLTTAIGLTAGIYMTRYFLRQPVPSLSLSQQTANIVTTEFIGKIEPAKTFKIAAHSPSVVEEIHVKPGDRIQSGQPLLSLKNLEAQKAFEHKQQQSQQQRQLILQQQQSTLQQQQSAGHRIFELQQEIARIERGQTPLAHQIAEAELRVSLVQNQADKLPLRQRQDSIERTKAIYELAQSRVERFSELHKEGAITKDRLEQARADFQIARSDYEVAIAAASQSQELENAKQRKSQLQLQLALAQQREKLQQMREDLQTARLEYSHASERLAMLRSQASDLASMPAVAHSIPVNATSDGVVVEVPVHVGDQIFTGNSLVGLAELSRLNVKIAVNARLINALNPGQQAKVKVGTGSSARSFEGKIVTVNPLPDRDFNYTVEVQFQNHSDALLVGQLATVQFLPSTPLAVSTTLK